MSFQNWCLSTPFVFTLICWCLVFLFNMLLILNYEALISLKSKSELVSLCHIHTDLWRYIYTIKSRDFSDGYFCLSWDLLSFGWNGCFCCFDNFTFLLCECVLIPPKKTNITMVCSICNVIYYIQGQCGPHKNNSSLFSKDELL